MALNEWGTSETSSKRALFCNREIGQTLGMLELWRVFCAIALSAGLIGCQSLPEAKPVESPLQPGRADAPSQVTPTEAIRNAEVYCNHAWRPFARNILHGVDRRGVRVDTPDTSYQPPSGLKGWWVPGEVNVGMPYKWGGFDSPEMFDAGIANGLAGGDVSSPAKRAADNAAVSEESVGVDCSGFVSRCLKLPRAYDSSQLPSICDPIADPLDLRPGDILNIPREHVMLVAGWAKPDKSWILYYETGGIPDWKPALKLSPLSKLLELGFQPLRYHGMAREERPTGKEVLTRSAIAKAIFIPDPIVGAP